MFGKLKKKNHEPQDDVVVDDTTVPSTVHNNTTTKKKMRFKAPEMVLLTGLVLIIGGMFWIMSGGLDDSTTNNVENNTTKESNVSKEEKPPYAYENTMQKQTNAPVKETEVSTKETLPEVVAKDEAPFVYANSADFAGDTLMPPPEEYEQNNTTLVKKSASIQKPNTTQKVSKALSKVVATPKPQEREKPMPVATPSASYVCSIVDMHRDMLGKEIMYFTKDAAKHTYIPAHAQASWDESGVWVKEKIMASAIDIDERMAEVDINKWIPALEFMTCVVLEEGGR